MASVISVSPFRCRMWDLHDRLESFISAESCRAEIESFERHGQLVPVIGRPVRNDPDYNVELICGARRLFVARHLNKPLLVELRELSDLDAIIAIDIENRQRSDVSAYERGLSYAQWIRAGYFNSQEAIARTLRVSSAHVSRMLKIARLPSVILNAFDSPTSICEGWALDLVDALEDPERRQTIIRAARGLAARSPRVPAPDAYRELMHVGRARHTSRSRPRDEVVKDHSGNPLFRIRRNARLMSFLVPLQRIPPNLANEVRAAIAEALQRPEAQVRAVQPETRRPRRVGGLSGAS